MGEKEQVKVIGMKKIGPFADNTTGEKIYGLSVFYHSLEMSNTEDEKGFIPTKHWLSLNDEKQKKVAERMMENGIGIYEVKFSIKLTGKKPTIKIDDFVYVKNLEKTA